MSGAVHQPLKVRIAERLAAAQAAADAADINSMVINTLDAMAALGRDVAQRSYLRHHGTEDHEEKMDADLEELIFQCLKTPFSQIYPELPAQVRSVLLDAFDDESFKLEDPLGWAEMVDEDDDAVVAGGRA